MLEFLLFIFMFMFMKLFINVNFLFLISFIMIFYLNWIEWSMLIIDFGMNFYSYGLTILLIWMMNLIVMNLNNYWSINLNMIMMIFMFMNFQSMNFMIFYFMFESSLLLIFIMILKWGYSINRFMAGYYIMFYTLIFSLPMLYIIMYIYWFNNTLSFYLLEFYMYWNFNFLTFWLMMTFLVKIPIYMSHSWLLKAHVEAPYFNSMILASLMLKLGGYGMLRLIILFKNNMFFFINMIMNISMLGMIILSLFCLRQIDMKMIVAISSIIHMGLMLIGMMTFFYSGMLGGYLMMIAHGMSSSGLFYLVNLIYKETYSRLIIINKGMMKFMPSLSLMWFLLCSSNMAAPMSLNLISEIMLLMSLMIWFKLFMILLFMYCILSFLYSLYLFSILQHGSSNMFMKLFNSKMLNYFNLIMHWLPLNILILNLYFI
uniref:NADH-ubiquinone oxidoreductase chain 4 n=1 Tax=Eucera floralia TaxID=599063 RepID=A0A343DRI7_9HYME|nr:NADH dehydrogenase subunit 4 [Eucera floralia]